MVHSKSFLHSIHIFKKITYIFLKYGNIFFEQIWEHPYLQEIQCSRIKIVYIRFKQTYNKTPKPTSPQLYNYKKIIRMKTKVKYALNTWVHAKQPSISCLIKVQQRCMHWLAPPLSPCTYSTWAVVRGWEGNEKEI